jgi:hypothetical protein
VRRWGCSGRRLDCRSEVLAAVGAKIGMGAVSGVAVRRAVGAAAGGGRCSGGQQGAWAWA